MTDTRDFAHSVPPLRLVSHRVSCDARVALLELVFEDEHGARREGLGQFGSKDVCATVRFFQDHVLPALKARPINLVEFYQGFVRNVRARASSATSLMSPVASAVLSHELNYKLTGSTMFKAIAGVDSAYWDAVGKSLGLLVWQVWAGIELGLVTRDADTVVRAYASCISRDVSSHVLARECEVVRKSHGIHHFKIKLGTRMAGMSGSTKTDLELSREAASVRDVLSRFHPDVRTALDCNGGYTSNEELAKVLRFLGTDIWFVEEPFPWLESTLERPSCSTTLAGGEQEYRPDVWLHALRHRTFDVIQPDIGYCGGPSTAYLLSRNHSRMNQPTMITLHSPQPDLGVIFAYHAMKACSLELAGRDKVWLELACVDDGSKQISLPVFQPKFLASGHISVTNGAVTLGSHKEASGWGVARDPRVSFACDCGRASKL